MSKLRCTYGMGIHKPSMGPELASLFASYWVHVHRSAGAAFQWRQHSHAAHRKAAILRNWLVRWDQPPPLLRPMEAIG
jgi:hypothetical protein